MQWSLHSLVWPARCLPPDWLLTGDHTSDGGAGAWPRGPHLVRSERVTGPRQASPGQIRSVRAGHTVTSGSGQWKCGKNKEEQSSAKIPKIETKKWVNYISHVDVIT